MKAPKLKYEIGLHEARGVMKILGQCQVPGGITPQFAGIMKLLDSPLNKEELDKYLEFEKQEAKK